MLKTEDNKSSVKKKGLIHGAVYIICIVIIALIWNSFLFSPLKVIGESMNPALRDGDIVMVNKISYSLNGADRFDMVLFPYKYDNSRNFIKRIIGLPGETIEIKDGVIYIDGEELEEYYGIYDGNEITRYSKYGPVTLADDEYFVMGDNRNHSDDSRSEDVGPVKADDIIGKISFRIWPFDGIGSLKHQ